jgi:hypothetical protein
MPIERNHNAMKYVIKALVLMLGVALSGCVSYSQHDLPAVENWPLASKETSTKPTAYLRFTAIHTFNGEQRAGGTNVGAWEKVLLDAFNQSGRFGRVTTDKVESNVYVYANVRNEETGNMGSAILTGITLFVVPSVVHNRLVLETVYKNRDGKVLGRIEKSETVTTWMQLLLVFALPFNPSADSIIQHLAQSCLEEAVRQKLI